LIYREIEQVAGKRSPKPRIKKLPPEQRREIAKKGVLSASLRRRKICLKA